MNSVSSHLTIIVTVILILVIEIGCCSYNENDIIDLIHRDKNFRRDPCYIAWKAGHDAMQREKLAVAFRKTYHIQKIVTMNPNEYKQRTQENTYSKNKDLSSWMVIGIIAGIGFCATFISFLRKVDNSTKNTINRHRNLGVPSTTSDVPDNARISQRTSDVLLAIDVNTGPSRGSNLEQRNPQQHLETNIVPLLARGAMDRGDSLPTYEEAMQMEFSNF